MEKITKYHYIKELVNDIAVRLGVAHDIIEIKF